MEEHSLLSWIAEGGSWLRYAVETQLLGHAGNPHDAVNDPKIQSVISRIKSADTGISALQTGKIKYTSAGNAFWDLFFLADIGLKAEDIQIQEKADALLALQRDDGTFILQDDMKPGYFCIASILLSSLAKMGYADNPRIRRFIETVLSAQRLDGGWHCAASRAVGKLLEKTASCPMDNLNVLMLLGQYRQYRRSAELNGAIDLLLDHWNRQKEPWRPYGFGIGGNFTKLRYPAVKYGILRVLDVLSLYPYAAESQTFREMLAFVLGKSANGRFFAESVSRSYAAFDFGQTKTPSRWITFLINRIQKRAEDGNRNP